MTQTLGSFFENAAPPLAWKFKNVGDTHAGIIESVEVRQGVDSDLEPLTDDEGQPVMLPVFTVVTDDTGEVNSLYGKPAVISALLTGIKQAGVDPETFLGHPEGYHVAVILSSLGTPSKASWSAPQRFNVTVTDPRP